MGPSVNNRENEMHQIPQMPNVNQPKSPRVPMTSQMVPTQGQASYQSTSQQPAYSQPQSIPQNIYQQNTSNVYQQPTQQYQDTGYQSENLFKQSSGSIYNQNQINQSSSFDHQIQHNIPQMQPTFYTPQTQGPLPQLLSGHYGQSSSSGSYEAYTQTPLHASSILQGQNYPVQGSNNSLNTGYQKVNPLSLSNPINPTQGQLSSQPQPIQRSNSQPLLQVHSGMNQQSSQQQQQSLLQPQQQQQLSAPSSAYTNSGGQYYQPDYLYSQPSQQAQQAMNQQQAMNHQALTQQAQAMAQQQQQQAMVQQQAMQQQQQQVMAQQQQQQAMAQQQAMQQQQQQAAAYQAQQQQPQQAYAMQPTESQYQLPSQLPSQSQQIPSQSQSQSQSGTQSVSSASREAQAIAACVNPTNPYTRDGVGVAKFWTISPEDIDFGEATVLGQGTFGVVYLAKYRGTKVAVKLPKIGLDEFQKETEVMLSVRHPNIVICLGMVQLTNGPGIVLEYCKNGSLRNYIECTALTPSVVVHLALDMANGLAFLHGEGIFHRDLSHNNVLVNEGTAKITDFGKAKPLAHVFTASNTLGAYLWMAPEAFHAGAYVAKSDIFSFGILLWELEMKNTHPYPSIPTQSLTDEVIVQWRMSGGVPTLPRTGVLCDLLKVCVNSYPQQRPTAMECIERLTKLQELLESNQFNYKV